MIDGGALAGKHHRPDTVDAQGLPEFYCEFGPEHLAGSGTMAVLAGTKSRSGMCSPAWSWMLPQSCVRAAITLWPPITT